jgi:tetratricopeptide (TPR) repeat protein
VVKHRLLIALVLVALTFVAHVFALSAGWIWDDNDYITANQLIQSSDGLSTIWMPGTTPQYYPLVFSGFWIEHALVGLEPTLYHLDNILLHAASVLLLWRVLVQLGVVHAFWIAALFAVHPMSVETVAWATERKNTQSLFFALASILCFVHAMNATLPRARGLHLAAFMLFVCALLSKTTAVFVAPVLVCIALQQRRSITPRFAMIVLPYFVIGGALGLFTAFIEKAHVGATGAEFDLTLVERVLLASRNIVFYITHFVFPSEQIFVYPRFAINASSMTEWIAFALMFVLAVAAVRDWRRSRAPALILLWLCAALFPALGFFDVWPFRFSYVADHFAYAAMPALATGSVLLLWSIVRSFNGNPRIVPCLLGIAVAACVPLSWIASDKYAGVEELWRDTIARNPSAWLAHNNLASELLEQTSDAGAAGDVKRVEALATEALEHATIAYMLKPDELTHASNQSEALRLLGKFNDALIAIDTAINTAPNFVEFQWMRGRLLEQMGRLDEARAGYMAATTDENALSIERDARRSLVGLAVQRKDFADALLHQQRVVVLSPRDADAIANLGALLNANGDEQGARREFLRALSNGGEFSGETAFVTTAVRYLRLAINSPLSPDEMQSAQALATRMAAGAPGDPSLRFIGLALELRAGNVAARLPLQTIEHDARAADATAFADEIAAFLRAN